MEPRVFSSKSWAVRFCIFMGVFAYRRAPKDICSFTWTFLWACLKFALIVGAGSAVISMVGMVTFSVLHRVDFILLRPIVEFMFDKNSSTILGLLVLMVTGVIAGVCGVLAFLAVIAPIILYENYEDEIHSTIKNFFRKFIPSSTPKPPKPRKPRKASVIWAMFRAWKDKSCYPITFN